MVFSAVRQWRAPRASQFAVTVARASGPSQYHALQFVGAGGPVAPPFGFLLLLLALFWNLLPNYPNQVMEGFVDVERWVLGTGFYVRRDPTGNIFQSGYCLRSNVSMQGKEDCKIKEVMSV